MTDLKHFQVTKRYNAGEIPFHCDTMTIAISSFIINPNLLKKTQNKTITNDKNKKSLYKEKSIIRHLVQLEKKNLPKMINSDIIKSTRAISFNFDIKVKGEAS